VAGRERHGKYIPDPSTSTNLPFSLISPYNSKNWPKSWPQKLAKILVALIATNGISVAIAPLSKQLSVKTIVGQSGYSAAATNAQEQ
jgi:hypothetical protein